MSKPKSSIRDSLRDFSQQTPINGLKELFDLDASIGLKLAWGIFMLLCAGSMVWQLVVLGMDYQKELTLTTVSLEEVERNRTSKINMCIDMSAIVTENVDISTEDNVASYLGQFRIGAFVIHRMGKPVWLNGTPDSSTEIGIDALRNISTKQATALPLSFDKRVNKVLGIFNISVLWAVSIRGSSGSYGKVWCLVLDLNDALLKAQKKSFKPEDLYVGFDATIPLRVSLSFYTLTDEPFREASVNTLRMASSATVVKNEQYMAQLDTDNIEVKHHNANVFDTHVNVQLRTRKYTFLDLRRKPCTYVSSDYFLPVGKGRATCYDSCRINAFKRRYGCVFDRHFNLFHGPDTVPFCHWFDIIQKFRDELHYNCSTGGPIPKLDTVKDLPESKHEYFYDISHDSLIRDLRTNASDNHQEFDYPDQGTICELKANISIWTRHLLHLIKQDLDEKFIGYCFQKCSYYRPCVQWEMEYGHIQRLKIFHNDTEEFISIYATKPDIIAHYIEKLETSFDGLIASIGGIFGFYFGFSVVAIVHVVFFCVYRYLN